jgi:ferredoxin-nitrite reductase
MKIEPLSVDFTDEQKRYLEGFTTGLQISRVGRGLGGGAGKANAEPTGPDAVHIKAQDKVIASGKKLVDQEKFKREEHPFDAYPRLRQQAPTMRRRACGQFRWRFGLLRGAGAGSWLLRDPNGIMVAGMADLAERMRAVLPRHHAREFAG